jgi:glutathione S-transferase
MLKIYAHPASQPARSVIWICLMKELPFQLQTNPKCLSDVNPRGQMPVIDDKGFVLAEMPAILSYLADKYGWEDLYPQNLQIRGRINAYLHSHHSLTRLATMKLMAPYVQVAFGGPILGSSYSYIFNKCLQESMSGEEQLAEGKVVVEQLFDYIEEVLLKHQNFIGETEQASIADIACYDEIAQLELANLIDFRNRKNITEWMVRIRKLPHHDVTHTYNTALGDIKTKPNTIERFNSAVETSMSELGKMNGVFFV